jgi:signal transduction histidine kinase
MVASTGLAVAAILLMAIAGGGAWTILSQRQLARDELSARVESAGRLLVASVEPLLGAGNESAVKMLLLNATKEGEFRRCRLVGEDGELVADGAPPKVSVRTKGSGPARAEPIPPGELSDPRYINASFDVVTRSEKMKLELSREVVYPRWAGWEAQTGLGAAGAAGFIALLLVYRRLKRRLRGVGAIGEALRALQRGESSAAALEVSGRFGPEAAAWNHLIAEREQLRKQVAGERAKETLGTRGDVKADLAYACDALWQGMVMVDDRLMVRYANGAAAIFLRAKREAMVGASIEEFVKDPALREAIRGVATGTVRHRTTIEMKRAEAEGGGVLRCNVRPVRKEDTTASVVVMIEDVTQQRVADEARNSFVAQATHELRTPLTNIRLYVEQAIEVGDSDPAMRAKCLDVINSESRRLERIVGDMLSVSEIEAGSFKLRASDVRLETLFEDLRVDFAATAKEKGIELRFELPPKLPPMRGDRDKITLALHNLVGNALKYTPEGGSVTVKVEADPSSVVVEVIDTGIGISAEETELIFEKFYRAKDKRVDGITGTGLGLALAREVVRLHGGDISVRSELNKGSTFTMTIPTMAEAA